MTTVKKAVLLIIYKGSANYLPVLGLVAPTNTLFQNSAHTIRPSILSMHPSIVLSCLRVNGITRTS